MEERFDYALFSKDTDRYIHNAMLTRAEAEEHERMGMRCIDVEATMDPNVPRFRDRRYVGSRPFSRRWQGR